MIRLTDAAAFHLRHLFRGREPADLGLRIFVHAGGCAGLQYGMAFEAQGREDDTVVESHGVRLYVDPFSAAYLQGACIEYSDELQGVGFRVENPNAAVICACGLSFRVDLAEGR